MADDISAEKLKESVLEVLKKADLEYVFKRHAMLGEPRSIIMGHYYY